MNSIPIFVSFRWRTIVAVLWFYLPLNCLFAHEISVHRSITLHAEISAQEFSQNYQAFLQTIADPDGNLLFQLDSQQPALNPFGWLAKGSVVEDDFRTDEGGIRSYNHFYDPLSDAGLSNFAPDRKIPSPGLGRDSFTWASQLNGSGVSVGKDQVPYKETYNLGTENRWSWQNARQFEFIGFIDSDPTVRNANLAKMFRSLGQVIHLLQDTTSPQHVRDEQHLDVDLPIIGTPWRSPMEKYGGMNVDKLNYAHSMLDWRAAGFKRMKDFWDRDLYTWNRSTPTVRNAQPLIDSEDTSKPTSKLGLAEFVNGNFIGDRHSYREFTEGSPYHFPFPSLYDGTDFNQLLKTPGVGKPTVLGGGAAGLRYVVGKTGQGRKVTHHGAVRYLIAANSEFGTMESGIYDGSIDDPDVLKDYHDILIPEAVKYSAGLLDYFFRGKFDIVSAAWDSQAPTPHYTITVRNISGDTFSGGNFTLLADDANGDRNPVGQPVSLTTPLEDTSTVELSYNGTLTGISKLLLVYQGTIGVSETGPSDSVDENIAIAAKAVDHWHSSFEQRKRHAKHRLTAGYDRYGEESEQIDLTFMMRPVGALAGVSCSRQRE